MMMMMMMTTMTAVMTMTTTVETRNLLHTKNCLVRNLVSVSLKNNCIFDKIENPESSDELLDLVWSLNVLYLEVPP